MRILFSVHTYLPDQNGVQNVTTYLAEGLANKGCEVHVITGNKNGRVETEVINGVVIHRIEAKTTMFSYSGDKEKYITLINEIKPDIFIPVCTQSWTLDWLPKDIDKLPGRKILYTHGYSGLTSKLVLEKGLSIYSLKSIVAYMIFKIRWHIYYLSLYKKLKKYDYVTYLCETDAGYLYAEKHKLPNSLVIENGVEERFFSHFRKCVTNNKLNIVCVSNYTTIKNQLSLINAFYKMKKPSELYLLGSSRTKYMERLVEAKKIHDQKYGKKEVHFLLGRPRDEITEVLAKCNVFATTSKFEAYPIAVFEAMAVGLPVVAYDAGNLKTVPGIEIVQNEEQLADVFDSFASGERDYGNLAQLMQNYTIEHNRIEGIIDSFYLRLCNLKG